MVGTQDIWYSLGYILLDGLTFIHSVKSSMVYMYCAHNAVCQIVCHMNETGNYTLFVSV